MTFRFRRLPGHQPKITQSKENLGGVRVFGKPLLESRPSRVGLIQSQKGPSEVDVGLSVFGIQLNGFLKLLNPLLILLFDNEASSPQNVAFGILRSRGEHNVGMFASPFRPFGQQIKLTEL